MADNWSLKFFPSRREPASRDSCYSDPMNAINRYSSQPATGDFQSPGLAILSPCSKLLSSCHVRPPIFMPVHFSAKNFSIRICSSFASIGVIRGLQSSALFHPVHPVFISLQKFFGLGLRTYRLLIRAIRSQRIVIKISFYHIFITKCVRNSISSQKHHNFQNYPANPRRSRRRESAQTNQLPIWQKLRNQSPTSNHLTAPPVPV